MMQCVEPATALSHAGTPRTKATGAEPWFDGAGEGRRYPIDLKLSRIRLISLDQFQNGTWFYCICLSP